MTSTPATQMRLEIGQIPATIERILTNADEVDAVAAAVRRARPRWVMIAARGTSDHAAVYAQYLIETHLGIPTGLAKPSVTTLYGARLAWGDGLLLAISQSGRSPDIVAVTEAARAGGATTVAITNDERSPLAEAAAHVLPCHAGPELAVPATKTYVAELAVIAALVARLEAGDDARRRSSPGCPTPCARARRPPIAGSRGRVRAAIDMLAATERALVVSRGYNLATALELALKLKETCGLFAEPYSTADFAHGPVILAGPGIPALAVRPDGPVGARRRPGRARRSRTEAGARC